MRPCLSNDRLNCQTGLHVYTPAAVYGECGTSPRTITTRIQELDKALLFRRILFSRNNTDQGEHEIEYGLGICNAMTNRSQCDERAPPPFQRSHLPTPATATLSVAFAMPKTNAWRRCVCVIAAPSLSHYGLCPQADVNRSCVMTAHHDRSLHLSSNKILVSMRVQRGDIISSGSAIGAPCGIARYCNYKNLLEVKARDLRLNYSAAGDAFGKHSRCWRLCFHRN